MSICGCICSRVCYHRMHTRVVVVIFAFLRFRPSLRGLLLSRAYLCNASVKNTSFLEQKTPQETFVLKKHRPHSPGSCEPWAPSPVALSCRPSLFEQSTPHTAWYEKKARNSAHIDMGPFSHVPYLYYCEPWGLSPIALLVFPLPRLK